jgi:hypothetical protein
LRKPSILFLSTYPVKNPRHGGQIRLANIIKYFKQRNFHVRSIAIYEEENEVFKTNANRFDIPFPNNDKFRNFKKKFIPFITDLLSGNFALNNLNLIFKNLPKNIDVIHLEQPWLINLALEIKKIPRFRDSILVYGSANIEWRLKKKIFQQFNLENFDFLFKEILSIERKAALKSNLTLAVTNKDLDELYEFGAKEVILCPNGVSPWKSRKDIKDKWSKILPKSAWALYIASGHPPNYDGFFNLIGKNLAYLEPNFKIVFVGSICESIKTLYSNNLLSALNFSRMEFYGILPEEDLNAIKDLAQIFILPIISGEGSNLKTAEALYSMKYILATKQAMRGYESYLDKRVCIFDSPATFDRQLKKIGKLNKLNIQSLRKLANRSNLTWSSCLKSYEKILLQKLKVNYDNLD